MTDTSHIGEELEEGGTHMINVSKLGEVVAVGFVVVDVPDGALGRLGVGSIESAGDGVGLGGVESGDGDVSVGLHVWGWLGVRIERIK